MRLILGLFALLVVVVVATFFAQGFFRNGGFPFGSNASVTINKQKFSTTVANTADKKQTGLSKQSSLAENSAMIFPFEKADYYSFWMKGMRFPIDIIFIRDNKIVTIHKNVQPPKENESPRLYQPEEPVDTVLEINAGLADKYNMKKGDTITMENVR